MTSAKALRSSAFHSKNTSAFAFLQCAKKPTRLASAAISMRKLRNLEARKTRGRERNEFTRVRTEFRTRDPSGTSSAHGAYLPRNARECIVRAGDVPDGARALDYLGNCRARRGNRRIPAGADYRGVTLNLRERPAHGFEDSSLRRGPPAHL